jgi:hypothetical protein
MVSEFASQFMKTFKPQAIHPEAEQTSIKGIGEGEEARLQIKKQLLVAAKKEIETQMRSKTVRKKKEKRRSLAEEQEIVKQVQRTCD